MREFFDQAAQSNNPLAWTIPARWRESVERQRALDRSDFPLSEGDQQLSLDALIEAASALDPQPLVNPGDSFEDYFAQFPRGIQSSASCPESEHFESPATFREYTTFNDELMSRETPRSPKIALAEDITDYSFYLERFHNSNLLQFRQSVDEVHDHEQRNWNFYPLEQSDGIPTTSFRDWLRLHDAFCADLEQCSLQSQHNWSLLVNDYGEYLKQYATEEDVSKFTKQRESIFIHQREMLEHATEDLENFDEFEKCFPEEQPVEEMPETFAAWVSQQTHSGPPLPADEQLRRDIENYEHVYLSQGSFPARYLLEFRGTIARIRQNEVEGFVYTPLAIAGQSRMTLQEFVAQGGAIEPSPGFSNTPQNNWDLYLLALRCYETYLAHPQHIAHWWRARDRWAESDRRELQGLSRDPLGEILEAMFSDLVIVEAAITHARDLIAWNSRSMTPAHRQQITESIMEFEMTAEFIEQSIELRATLTEIQRAEIELILSDARTLLWEFIDAVRRGVVYEAEVPTPTPFCAQQASSRGQREETPESDFDIQDHNDLILAMQQEADEEDNASIVMGGNRDEEITDEDTDWYPETPTNDTQDDEEFY